MSIPKDLRNVKEIESTEKFECLKLSILLVKRAVESTKTEKVQISPFYFLGFFYTLQRNGIIYRRVKPQSVKHERYILKKCSKKKSYNELREQLESYLSHIRKGDSLNLESRLITYIRSLYENTNTT